MIDSPRTLSPGRQVDTAEPEGRGNETSLPTLWVDARYPFV